MIDWTNDRFEREMMEQAGQLYDQNYFELSRHEVNEMPKLNEMFGGSFLKAADLQNKVVTVTIEDVTMELLRGDNGEESKWVMSFAGKDRKLVLNKTNANMIASMLGDDTDMWIGKPIKLYSAKVDFQGRMVDAVRVYQDMPTDEADGDSIPF